MANHSEFCTCFVVMNGFSVADPSVTRYHVQWLPEYCSHNETRGPEKSVTQVSPCPPALPAAFVRGRWRRTTQPWRVSRNRWALNKPQAGVLNILTRPCGEACAGQENTLTQTMVPGMGDHSPPASPVTLLNLSFPLWCI